MQQQLHRIYGARLIHWLETSGYKPGQSWSYESSEGTMTQGAGSAQQSDQ